MTDETEPVYYEYVAEYTGQDGGILGIYAAPNTARFATDEAVRQRIRKDNRLFYTGWNEQEAKKVWVRELQMDNSSEYDTYRVYRRARQLPPAIADSEDLKQAVEVLKVATSEKQEPASKPEPTPVPVQPIRVDSAQNLYLLTETQLRELLKRATASGWVACQSAILDQIPATTMSDGDVDEIIRTSEIRSVWEKP